MTPAQGKEGGPSTVIRQESISLLQMVTESGKPNLGSEEGGGRRKIKGGERSGGDICRIATANYGIILPREKRSSERTFCIRSLRPTPLNVRDGHYAYGAFVIWLTARVEWWRSDFSVCKKVGRNGILRGESTVGFRGADFLLSLLPTN